MTATQMHRARDINAAIEHLMSARQLLRHHGFAAELQVIDLAVNLIEDSEGITA